MGWIRTIYALAQGAKRVLGSVPEAKAAASRWRNVLENGRSSLAERGQAKAEAGDAQAQFDLAERFHDGLGVAKDYYLAAEWFRKAADQGHAQAQCNLGMMYVIGRGVVRNHAEAYKWLTLAANSGHALALKMQKSTLERMAPEEIEEGKRKVETFSPEPACPKANRR